MVTTEKSVDPRVKRTRKLLQQAFMELFMEKSFASISIQDITERATVNRATFYAHFPDKYALLDSMMREQFQRYVAERLPPASTWDIQSLRALIKAVFDFLDELHQHCRPSDTQHDPLMERALQQEIVDILLSRLKVARAASARRQVRIETVASVMSWAIFGTAVQWSRGEQTPGVEEVTNEVLRILTEGVVHLVPGLLPE